MDEELQKLMAQQGITIKYGFDNKPQYYKKGKMLSGKAAGDAALLHTKTSNSLKHSQTRSGVDDFLSHPLTNYFALPTALYTAGSKVAKKGFKPGSVALDLLGAFPAFKGAGVVGTSFLTAAKVGSLADDISELKNKNKNKKNKYAYGGTAMDVDSPYQSLSEIQRLKDDVLAETSNDPLVSGLRGIGGMMMNTGMSMVGKGMSQSGNMDGVGGFLQDNMGTINDITKFGISTQKYASGGTIGSKRSEVEGQEVAEFPTGEVGQFKGPSHGEGGIPVDLPIGTDIYSKRVKVNGETMANRKLIREKQLSKFEKLFDKNPLDKNLQRTLDRIKSNNESLDNKDMMIQNSIHDLHNSSKRAYGGTIYEDEENLYDDEILEENEDIYNEQELYDDDSEEEEEYLEDEDEDYLDEDEEDYYALGGTVGPGPYKKPYVESDLWKDIRSWYNHPEGFNQKYNYATVTDPEDLIGQEDNPDKGENPFSNILGNFSTGDLLGMGGQLYGAFSARKNTLDNRKGDTPNINPYKDYGKAGLANLQNARTGMEYTRDLSLQDLEASRNTMNSRNRNSARGINTLRALGLATDTSVNNSKNKVFADYSNRMNNLSLQESNMLNQRDRMVMQGEGIRDMNDRRDRDAFYTNMGADKQNISQAIQNLGKNINTGLERGLNSEALSALSKYFDVDITADGFKMTNKKAKK